ncbi:MAG: hypothetical protein PW792_13340 [Acidobacteriaceae bacterium]|nr:hypothetical protein [Acidobacteriaceae bacterium]
MMRVSSSVLAIALIAAPCLTVTAAAAQTAAPAAPRTSGTVKSIGTGSLVVTSASGDVTVTVPEGIKVLLVAPGSTNLKSATSGTVADISTGDRALVTGTAGDQPTALTATRVIVMKSAAIEQSHASEEAAWTQGIGGIVKSVDPATGALQVSSGQKMIAVQTTASTVVRRYSGTSVRFADATLSHLADIHPGDQLRARGTKSPDGSSLTADAIVAGTFHNYSGLITAIDPSAGTVTLKDLATKKVVTVAVTSSSDVRRLPPMMAKGIAARLKGGSEGGEHAAAATHADGEAHMRSQREGSGLSGMMQRLPTETLSGLKTGEAVMIVSTQATADSTTSTAVTLLAGVEAILTAPSGDTMTLSPWSLSGGESGGGAEGGAGSQ